MPLSGLPSAGLFVSTGVTSLTSTLGGVLSTNSVSPAVSVSLPLWPALSVTSTFTLSPGLIGSVVISKFPLSSVVPVPIVLPFSSVTTTGAFGSSDLPFTIPLSGVPSDGLVSSTGVTVSISTFGPLVSFGCSILPAVAISVPALPALSIA